MILKLGMRHQAIKLYKNYINHDPGLTLTHFMARSTYVTYPRSQVSVYRTIVDGIFPSVFRYTPHRLAKVERGTEVERSEG